MINCYGVDPKFIAADGIRDRSGCVLRYERSFVRPVLEGPKRVAACRDRDSA